MKKFLLLLVFLLLMLASCEYTAPTAHDDAALNPDTGITMRTIHPVYDDSCESVSILIENNSDDIIEFGAAWTLERLINGVWHEVRTSEPVFFYSIAYGILPDGRYFDTCRLINYVTHMKDGEYRIVKEIGGAYYTAEFSVGDSEITANSPHGFMPLENLSNDYSLTEASADGCVIIRHGEMESAPPLEDFFSLANLDGYMGQLRIASLAIEGDVILTDVTVNESGRIDYAHDSTRDAWGSGEIERAYYSRFVTDGTAIYLSNSGSFDPNTAVYLCDAPADVCGMVSGYYSESELSVWSPDGRIRAATGDAGKLCINAETWGITHALKESAAIIELVWQDNETLLAVADLGDTSYYEFIKIKEGTVERMSYTTSAHPYEWHDGEIIIPE